MNASYETLQTGSPSVHTRDEKQSSVADSSTPSADDVQLHLREDSGDYPAPLARWIIVIALLLGEFLVSNKTPVNDDRTSVLLIYMAGCAGLGM